MRSRFLAFLPLLMLLGRLHGVESARPDRFEPEILKFEAIDRRSPPPPRPILFVGSSSIRLWTGLPREIQGRPVLNRGFGGSTFKDLLFHFDRVVLAYGPAVMVVYEGDNDLAEGRTPAEVSRDLGLFLDRAQTGLPGTRVVLLTVKPSPARKHLDEARREFHLRLQRMVPARSGVVVADVASPLLDTRGQPDPRFFAQDGLHLNAAGYEAWRKPVLEAIEQSLRR